MMNNITFERESVPKILDGTKTSMLQENRLAPGIYFAQYWDDAPGLSKYIEFAFVEIISTRVVLINADYTVFASNEWGWRAISIFRKEGFSSRKNMVTWLKKKKWGGCEFGRVQHIFVVGALTENVCAGMFLQGKNFGWKVLGDGGTSAGRVDQSWGEKPFAYTDRHKCIELGHIWDWDESGFTNPKRPICRLCRFLPHNPTMWMKAVAATTDAKQANAYHAEDAWGVAVWFWGRAASEEKTPERQAEAQCNKKNAQKNERQARKYSPNCDEVYSAIN